MGLVSVLAAAAGRAEAAPARGREPGLPGLAKLAERVRPAVVHVRGTLSGKNGEEEGEPGSSVSVGSGFLVDDRGGVITNDHVIRDIVSLRVRLFDGREFPACVLGTDELADVALLQVESEEKLAPLPLGDSDGVQVGQPVIAIGSPFGFAHSVTAGIVSATERVVDDPAHEPNQREEEPPYSFYIQTDASINVGNSGGPLIDTAGRVIGVNAAFWGGSQPSVGVGFAIPIDVVKQLIPQLRKRGYAERSFLGVESQPLSADLAAGFGRPTARGALVARVLPGSAAATGGLLAGDIVIGWGEHSLATRNDFRIFSQLTPPGTRVKVTALRGPARIEREITTVAAPKQKRIAPSKVACGKSGSSRSAAVGLEVAEVSAARAAELGERGGALVVRVKAGLAADAGIKVGEVITRAGEAAIEGPKHLERILQGWSRRAPLPLLVRTRMRTYWTTLSAR